MYMIKDRHGTYYLRIVLDRDARQRLGKREYRRSLGTKSIREARRKLPEAYMKAMDALAGASAGVHIEKAPEKLIGSSAPKLSKVLLLCNEHHQRIGSRSKTIWEKDYSCNLLIKIIGDKPIDQYAKDDARIFRDAVIKLPPRFQRLIDDGLSINKIIKDNTGKKCLSYTTYNNLIRALSSVFSYGIKEGYLDTNIFTGMKIHQKGKVSSQKDIFTSDDLRIIFDYLKDFKGNRDDRYWIPLIAYYSGMRLNEIAQLYKSDVLKVDGIWCISINDNTEDKRLKNTNAERIIPVHSELINLGILEYINTVEDRLFPMLKYSDRHGYATQVSIFFTKTLRKLGISTPERKVSFHSVRHTVINQLKQKGFQESLIGGLAGHSSGASITFNRYGKSYTPDRLIDVVEAIEAL